MSSTVDGVAALVEYDYDLNDRLLTETRVQTLAGMRRFNDGTMLARASPDGGRALPAPSVWSGWMLVAFCVTSVCAFLYPLSLLRHRRRSHAALTDGRTPEGLAARRRRIRRGTISLFCVPLMLIGGETVLGLNRDAQLYHAMQEAAAAAIGWCDPAVGETVVVTYAWDDNGNMLSRACQVVGDPTGDVDEYDYDQRNRLIEVRRAGASPVSYSYDADGVRLGKTDAVSTTTYITDKNRSYAQVVAETIVSSKTWARLTTVYCYGDDLISRTSGLTEKGAPTLTTRYYHYDGQMSTRQLTGENDEITDTYTYDAFGVMLDATHPAGTPSENNYLYTGEQYDADAGSYYLRARYYNQGVGRFISADPFNGYRHDPVSLHKYLYAHANPVMYRDPSGLTSLTELKAVMTIMLRLFTMVGRVVSVLNRVSAVLDLIDLITQVFQLGSGAYRQELLKGIARLKKYVQGANPLDSGLARQLSAQGRTAAFDELGCNKWRILKSLMANMNHQRFTSSIAALTNKDSKIVLFMPTTELSFVPNPLYIQNTPLKFGKRGLRRPLALYFGHHRMRGRLLGMGVVGGTSKSQRRRPHQWFRMDWHTPHTPSSQYRVIRPAGDKDLAYWNAYPPYHFHILADRKK